MVHLLYVETSISSGSTGTSTSKRFWTWFKMSLSPSVAMKLTLRPFVPNRPARPTWNVIAHCVIAWRWEG